MGLQGKGFWIWNIRNCEKGDPDAIAALAQKAGLSHVVIKVADRFYPDNVTDSNIDLVPPLAGALRSRGIQVWGWQYVYGYEPGPEARIAVQRIKDLHLDGYAIDAEGEYKLPGRDQAALRYVNDLRAGCPNTPLAICSYRFPTLHPQLPWKIFLDHVDYNMPQVYWEKAHNPADQLARCIREFRNLSPFRPILPVGPTYKGGGWRPTEEDIKEFIKACQSAGLPAYGFFSWDECRRDLPGYFELIGGITASAPPPPAPKEITQQLVDALNSHDPAKTAALYQPQAVHILALRTLQGGQAIQSWYSTFFQQVLPNAVFTLTSTTGSGVLRHFTWKAVSPQGRVDNGSDTLGIVNDKILYHYSAYNVIKP